ncbi:VanZ family protein [Salinibacterium soli]|uniref:VanZ family protein n=1 Tax=Antiquaquibacter soli TaxID=3064523 RepID=A0ABT9BKX5_9MICO|nr:VanZ family protein [Protaetiibacter sp. WY-16]MDO7881673.1 VanZ family protein [Protaetiibacter sp. WY-16]
MFLRHPILSLATIAYLALVGWLTLTPRSGAVDDSILWPLARFFARFDATDWLTFSRLEFAANIALFVPLGLFFVLLLGRRQWWLAIFLGVVATVAIELAQRGIAGRVSDPRDLVANSIGAILGTLLALLLTAAGARRARARAALSGA